jgi:glycosyltransferase involved in cell wall biosynthesis
MNRPLVYDITHLRNRAKIATPTGIDRVDLAYARHFAARKPGVDAVCEYAIPRPRLSAAGVLERESRVLEARWMGSISEEGEANFRNTRAWILGELEPATRPRCASARESGVKRWSPIARDRWFHYAARRFYANELPNGSLYLNIAQHAAECTPYFQWIHQRRDVVGVFFIHDLLPLDFPEFWWEGHRDLFAKRIGTILDSAKAIITSTEVVRDRILRELHARGRPRVPVFARALPSPLEHLHPESLRDEALSARPYFVMLGTIEPRKNHALALNLWRRFADLGRKAPKLIVVGSRGWENAHVVALLDRCPAIAPNVLEISNLSDEGLGRLLANSRALLMPSFAEGYGFPMVEALGVGAPVVASDIPVFRETTRGKAIFCDPLNGAEWGRVVESLIDETADTSTRARARAREFALESRESYFGAVEAFLDGL